MGDKIPKIFISYSWIVSERVLELAERFVANGVDVILDKWDLKEGQDKYAFMEKCVVDPEIDKVLLICDKSYCDKANLRAGGVGDETVIISPEIYNQVNQEKFLPIIFEVDEYNKPYIPAYIKSRIYFDLSTEDDQYEVEYEKLLRNIYNKPLYKKPALGKKPDWLETETVDLSPIRDLIRQTRGYTGGNKTKADFLLRKAVASFITALLGYASPRIDSETLLKKIEEMKPLRDLYVDFIDAVIYCDLPLVDTITSFFEQTYNDTHDANINELSSCSASDFELYDFFIWETFIATAAVLFHYEKYAELRGVLLHTYFLRDSYFDESRIKEHDYCVFRKYLRTIEGKCKADCDEPNLHSLAGRMLIRREKKPLLTSQSLSRADVLLYQLHNVIGLSTSDTEYWFPFSYCYFKGGESMWIKLKSKKYCQKVLPLFGVSTIEELKKRLAICTTDRRMSYPYSFDPAPNILSSINLDSIATLN